MGKRHMSLSTDESLRWEDQSDTRFQSYYPEFQEWLPMTIKVNHVILQ